MAKSALIRLGDVQMNIFAILNHMGVFFKEEPVRQLHAALEKAGYEVVYPVDDKDLIKMIEMNHAFAVCCSTGINTH